MYPNTRTVFVPSWEQNRSRCFITTPEYTISFNNHSKPSHYRHIPPTMSIDSNVTWIICPYGLDNVLINTSPIDSLKPNHFLSLSYPSNPSKPLKTHQNPSRPIKSSSKSIKPRQNPSKPSKPIKTYFKTHQNPSSSTKTYQGPSRPTKIPSRPFKTHQNPSIPIKIPSKPIKTHQNPSRSTKIPSRPFKTHQDPSKSIDWYPDFIMSV